MYYVNCTVHIIQYFSVNTSGAGKIMNLLPINKEVSDRLRGFIKQRFPARGKFKELEAKSGIGVNRWQNFFYKKQEVTQELLQFWISNFNDELYPDGINSLPELFPTDDIVSARLRMLIEKTFPERGRFSQLESASSISASKWKSVFYKKQKATQEILRFWCTRFPASKNWLINGIQHPDYKEYPFLIPAPKHNSKSLTVTDRFVWVIKEFASPVDDGLYKYLSDKSHNKISIHDWIQVIQGGCEPTVEMLSFIAGIRPYFLIWILTGNSDDTPQVNPNDSLSIKKWVKDRGYAYTVDKSGVVIDYSHEYK